jgi:hypothetical protein
VSGGQQLYDRRVQLIVGKPTKQPNDPFVQALVISDLRVTFKVERDDKPEPNKSEIAVYNLGPASRAALEGKGTPVVLLAGYASGISQCFSGTTRIVESEKQGTDWVTRIRCGDGERAYTTVRINESMKPGASVKDFTGKLVQAIAKDPGNVLDVASKFTRTYVSGYAAHGLAAAELSEVMAAEGYSWSLQDGRFEALKPTGFTKDAGPLFTPNTGLIGTPTLGTPDAKGGPQVWKLKVLLEPRLRPGQRFEVERTVSVNGQPVKKEGFRANKVTHTGDTHGGGDSWSTEIEAIQV